MWHHQALVLFHERLPASDSITAGSPRHRHRRYALQLSRLALALAAVSLGIGIPAAEMPPAVAETIAETCAIRGLALRRPLQVRPMAAFEGGYTPGIGSVVWQDDDAEVWRQGWCALGVYCAAPAGKTANVTRSPGESGLAGPRGLYDTERATLFVAADGDAVPAATIAHEATHALQHQNYPQLAAIHLWHNRDLAAAANAALEGMPMWWAGRSIRRGASRFAAIRTKPWQT